MLQKLLVLLGNGNDGEGNLSETAILRADTAVTFLNDYPEYLVIPTGSFGDHFNNFHIAHGVLLRTYMIQKGIAPNRILPHLSIAGALIVLGFTLPNAFPSNGVIPNVVFPFSNCHVLLFWYMYLRLASTASSARRVLIAVEKFYDIPGISATHQRLRFWRIKTTISIVFLLISLIILLKWVL